MSDIDKVRVLLGPPGTGKTTTLLDEIDRLLAGGVSPREIAFVSYTKAAVREAKERASRRFDIDPDEFEFFRTIHSMALRSIGRVEVMSDAHWKAFGETFRYEFSDQWDEPTLNFAEDGDCLRSLHELRRVKRCSVEEAILHAGDVPPHVDTVMVETFARRLAAFKKDKGLVDFTDMLERSLAAQWRPPVRFAFIDETQDNSRLQNALTKRWFWESRRCELVTYAGDDDQAIYGWSGGDRAALVRLASRAETRVLEQSWRIPARVHAMAQSIIRENSARVDKSYRARDEAGDVDVVDDARAAVSRADPEAFVLVRNLMFAAVHREACLEDGRLFSCEIGPAAPLDRKDTLGAFRAVVAWRRGANATAKDFRSLLALVPSKIGGQTIVPRGGKVAAEKNSEPVPAWRAREQWGISLLVGSLLQESDPFRLTKLDPEDRNYLARVLARDPELRGGRTVITSIHRSKGREMPCVVVSPDMARRTHHRWAQGHHEGREEERSVQYVAVTRAKRRVIIERPLPGDRHYDYQQHLRAANA